MLLDRRRVRPVHLDGDPSDRWCLVGGVGAVAALGHTERRHAGRAPEDEHQPFAVGVVRRRIARRCQPLDRRAGESRIGQRLRGGGDHGGGTDHRKPEHERGDACQQASATATTHPTVTHDFTVRRLPDRLQRPRSPVEPRRTRLQLHADERPTPGPTAAPSPHTSTRRVSVANSRRPTGYGRGGDRSSLPTAHPDDAKPAQATTNDIAVMTTATTACTNG